MARTTGAVLGKQSGRIGQVYGALVHGEQVYRAMPAKPKKTDLDRIPSEVLDRREKFKTLVQLAKAFKPAADIGFDNYRWVKPFISPFNYFVKVNKNSVYVMGGEAEIDYGSLLCAQGSLAQAGFGNASFAEPSRVSVTYSTAADLPNADAQDKVYLFVYQPDTKQALISIPALRTTGTVELRIPSTWTGLTVHCYGFAIGDGRDTKGLVSDSSYIGTGIIG